MRRFAQVQAFAAALAGFAAFSGFANAQTITQWNFNASTLTPSIGSGTFTNVVTAAPGFVSGVNSTDPVVGTNNSATVSTFPAQGAGSNTAGIGVSVSTAGATDIVVRFDSQLSATASRYFQFSYTTDGSTYTPFGSPIDYGVFPAAAYSNNRAFDLSGVAGVAGNAAFGFRVLSVFDPNTGTSYAAVGGGSYGTSGTFRNDMVTVSQGFSWIGGSGNDITTPANFAGAAAPTTTGTLLFGSSGGANLTPNVPAPATVDQVIFQTTAASSYTLSGSALTVGAGIVNNSSVSHTISAPVTFNAQQAVYVPNASGGLNFTGPVTLFGTGGAAALSVQGAGNVTFSNTISGGPATGNGLRIGAGTGTTTLAADNTYTGATLVSGNLLANNPNAGGTGSATGAGTVTVNSGGRLGGTGSVAGPISLLTGGNIRPGPGSAIGTLLAGSTVTFAANSILETHVGSASSSQLNATGNIATPTGAMTLSLINNGTLNLGGATNYQYTIANGAAVPNFAGTTFNVVAANFGGFASAPIVTNPGGTGIMVSFTPVPEPTTILGFAAGTMFVGNWIRKRRQAK